MSTSTASRSYDVCGPLPEGTTVLEASAGTGKTHTIASLAVRYVAEGHARIDELMLVTFGRAARGRAAAARDPRCAEEVTKRGVPDRQRGRRKHRAPDC